MGALSGLVISLEPGLPAEFEVGRGGFLVLHGTVSGGDAPFQSLEIESEVAGTVELFPAGRGGADEREPQRFIALVEVPGHMVGHAVTLTARVHPVSGGAELEQRLGSVAMVKTRMQPAALPDGHETGAKDSPQPLVAICMATYAPDPSAFRRQIESIVTQTHGNWICIVNDDCSPPERFADIARICALDRRFSLHRNSRNLGFYANFEQALRRVPIEARFVAFADQDDYWYPRKLEILLQAMDGGAQLAYSDMRIVDEAGSVLSDSYWRGRKNEYRDLATVLLANTVTGAASLFRRELLDDVLPFPARIGDAFHDHWVACVALARGRIEYVNEPLYDYVQHGKSVIGHCDFHRWSLGQRAGSLGRFLVGLARPAETRDRLRRKIGSALAVYRGECLRLALISRILKLRLRKREGFSGALNLFNGGLASASKLLGAHLRILVTGRTTDDAEFRLAMAYLARHWEKGRLRSL